jgi:ankyrin repeat protein
LNKRQESRDRHEEEQAILEWLTPADYASQHNDFIRRQQKGTGQWLLKSAEFQNWLENTQQTLFCPGIPGAGKTILAAIVVDHLCTKLANDPTIGIAYIYCNFRRQHEQTANDLLASLVKQFAQDQSSINIPDALKDLYKRHKNKRTRLSFDEISEAFISVSRNYSRIFIIIDALDECQFVDGCRMRLLSEIFQLQTKTGANVLATSRPIPEINRVFEGRCVLLEIRASDEDVGNYLDNHMSCLPGFVTRIPGLREQIKNAIMKSVDGMSVASRGNGRILLMRHRFLLVQLYLDSLSRKRSPKAIQAALNNLLTGSGAYDQAYSEAMERVIGQDSEDLAKQALSWITCSTRPLAAAELQSALAVEPGNCYELDKDNITDVEDIVSVCGGLVTVDKESDIIRLIHYTAQEYFERTEKYWFPRAQTEISSICITYLSFNQFQSGACLTDKELEERRQENPLYDYAAQNWGHHARQAALPNGIIPFLESQAKVEAASQAMNARRRGYWDVSYSQDIPGNRTGLHLAAYFGLAEIAKVLLQRFDMHDSVDTYGRTPLSLAAENGHEAVVIALLSSSKIDANSRDTFWGQTPLSFAAHGGHDTVVRLLLDSEGVDVNCRDLCWDQTPILSATRKGHSAVVKLLITSESVDAEAKDKDGQTALWIAAFHGHADVARVLLESGRCEPNQRDEYGKTPIMYAIIAGYTAVVEAFLEFEKVDVNARDRWGWTPLASAVSAKHEAIVKLLLDNGRADVNSRDEEGRTPFFWAVKNNYPPIFRLLKPLAKTDELTKQLIITRILE